MQLFVESWQSTYGGRYPPGADGFGHLAQNLVPVTGCVSSSLDLFLIHFLAVDVESDAGGRNQDVELWKETEKENRYLLFRPLFEDQLWSGFDPGGLQTIRLLD